MILPYFCNLSGSDPEYGVPGMHCISPENSPHNGLLITSIHDTHTGTLNRQEQNKRGATPRQGVNNNVSRRGKNGNY